VLAPLAYRNQLTPGTQPTQQKDSRNGKESRMPLEPQSYAEFLAGPGIADEDLPDQLDRPGWPRLRSRFAEVITGSRVTNGRRGSVALADRWACRGLVTEMTGRSDSRRELAEGVPLQNVATGLTCRFTESPTRPGGTR
jgi:hypothetical protein